MKKYGYTLLLFVFGLAFAKAQTVNTANIDELKRAIRNAVPGDTIVMNNGEWKDAYIKFKANGTADKPIILRSQQAGKVRLTGSSRLRIGGEYLEVHGLWFDGGNAGKNAMVRFSSDSENPARYCRVTNCAITGVNPDERDLTSYYITLEGHNNRVDHCSLTGKLNKGPAIAVRLKNSIDNNHRIDHNYFGERKPLGFNGGETIRIGTSTYSKQSSKTIVENNFFEKCSGEMEIISIKSAKNIVRNNLFLESEGTITLRHGDYNLVEGNIIIGNNLPKIGGIRMINKGNIVRNNIIIGVKSRGYRAPIVIMNGIPGAKLNEYDQVVDGIIQNNTIINSSPVEFAINSRKNATALPINTTFVNNLFYSTERNIAIFTENDISGITLQGNVVNSQLIADFEGVRNEDFKVENSNGIIIPSKDSDALLQGVKTSPKVRRDATGALRSQLRVGAVVPGNFKPPTALTSQAGVSFIPIDKLRNMVPEIKAVEVKIAPGDGNLDKAIRKASQPTTFILEEGIYYLKKGSKVLSDVSIIGAGRSKTFLKVSGDVDKVPQYFFRMDGAKRFEIEGVTLDGDGGKTAVKYAVTSPSSSSNELYNVFIDQSDLLNFTNSDGGAVFKAYKDTKADTVSITNSRIKNAFRGLNLSYEKDEGEYSAEVLILKNSIFKDISEFAVNFRRTGEDPQSAGGKLIIDHCVFYKVDDMEKGRIIEPNGIAVVEITNSVIDNSRATTTIVQLKGENQSIKNTVVFNSGKVKLTGGASEDQLKRQNPKWVDHDHFELKESSNLKGAATDQSDIGILQNHFNK